MDDSEKELTRVYFRHKYGICPQCNSPMNLYAATHQLFDVSIYGVPIKEIDCKEVYTNICPNCKFKIPMQKTIDGIVPIPIGRHIESNKIDEKPVGIVER